MRIGLLNRDMLGVESAPGEHVDWSSPDIMNVRDAEYLLGDIAAYAESHPHMIVFEIPCVCAVHNDGSVTTSTCPVHAAVDPCLTMSLITGRRRVGTIRRGRCTSCGWSS